MNNENKKLSQNRKRRFERKIRKDDEVKTLLKKLKQKRGRKTIMIKLKIQKFCWLKLNMLLILINSNVL